MMTRSVGPVETRAPVVAPTGTTAPGGPSAAGPGASTASTIEPARPLTAHESKGFCDRVAAFFKGIVDRVSNALSSFFKWIDGLFPEEEELRVPEAGVSNPPVILDPRTRHELDLLSLDVFRMQTEGGTRIGDEIIGGYTRDQVLAFFNQDLTHELQEAIKLRMWELARQNIDPSNLRSNDRQAVFNWADRVLRGEVRIEGEVDDRADIVPYVNILDGNSLFRQALEDVIRAAAVGAGYSRPSSQGEVFRVLHSGVMYFHNRLPVAVQEAIGSKMLEFARQDTNPNRPPLNPGRVSNSSWAFGILLHRPLGEEGIYPSHPDTVYYSGTLLNNDNIFLRAINAVIADGGAHALYATRLRGGWTTILIRLPQADCLGARTTIQDLCEPIY